jgi:redox-sensitive bicupin YhaK (pirin superfamily)
MMEALSMDRFDRELVEPFFVLDRLRPEFTLVSRAFPPHSWGRQQAGMAGQT